MSLLARPLSYVIWAGFVAVVLAATAPADPYIFAFTSLFVAWSSGAVAAIGIAVCIFAKKLTVRERGIILVAMLAVGVVVGAALAYLGTFSWA